MDLKARLREGLVFSRGFTERLLDDFKTPDDWMTTPVGSSNHAMWIVGHLAVAENFFIKLAGGEVDVREDYAKLFGKGSTPKSNAGDYPESSEVLAYLRQRREALLETLDHCSEEDFAKPTPEGAPPFMHDLGAMFQMMVWHESLHSGQLTTIRRSLGHGPIA